MQGAPIPIGTPFTDRFKVVMGRVLLALWMLPSIASHFARNELMLARVAAVSVYRSGPVAVAPPFGV